jgi:predicted transcriptional regulator
MADMGDIQAAIQRTIDDSLVRVDPELRRRLDEIADVERIMRETYEAREAQLRDAVIDAYRHRVEKLEGVLRRVKADRPSAHSDEVWAAIADALDES